MAVTHLVINYISFEENSILVGATDNERWAYEQESGGSGSNAFSFVYAEIIDNGKGWAPTEHIGFHISPDYEPYRTLAEDSVRPLSRIAWEIKNRNLSWEDADNEYFGKSIMPKLLSE